MTEDADARTRSDPGHPGTSTSAKGTVQVAVMDAFAGVPGRVARPLASTSTVSG